MSISYVLSKNSTPAEIACSLNDCATACLCLLKEFRIYFGLKTQSKNFKVEESMTLRFNIFNSGRESFWLQLNNNLTHQGTRSFERTLRISK